MERWSTDGYQYRGLRINEREGGGTLTIEEQIGPLPRLRELVRSLNELALFQFKRGQIMSFGVRLQVWGENACFTRPEFKTERVSYDVITPSAARGVLEAIYWKPAIRWIIDEIHILEPVHFTNFSRNEVGSKISSRKVSIAMSKSSIDGLRLYVNEDRQLRSSTVLVKPAYIIFAHFELTLKSSNKDSGAKHLDIFNRRARRGQCFHRPYLGTREFPADFELLAPDTPTPQPRESALSLGFSKPRDLGLMLLDIDHAAAGRPSMFFRARLANAVLKIPHPRSEEVLR